MVSNPRPGELRALVGPLEKVIDGVMIVMKIVKYGVHVFRLNATDVLVETVKVLTLREKVLKDLSGICVSRRPGCEKLIWLGLGEEGRRFMKSSTTVTTAQNAR